MEPPCGDQPRNRQPWYQPLEEPTEIDHAAQWVLSQPGIFLNTVSDMDLLPLVLNAASRFKAHPTEAEMQADLARLEMEPLFT